MKFFGYRTLKTGIGAAAAMLIAKHLGLQYAVSAGIITILSMQNTKKKSVKMALQRMASVILALFISTLTFKVMGFSEMAFGLFLLAFIPAAVRLNLSEGIVVSSVLATHLLVEKSVALSLICNELSLMGVGASVALLLNLYMPSIEGHIKDDQAFIEESMKKILFKMAKALREHQVSLDEDDLFEELEAKLQKGRKLACKNLNNYFLRDESYYVHYMEMRVRQFETIKRMREHFQRFFMTYEQSIMMGDFTEQVGNSLYEENSCEQLLEELNLLRESFKKMALPETREEFENRAMLFQFLNDMEQFLMIKNEFKQNSTSYYNL